MKRLDLLVAIVVSVLASFVGVEVYGMRVGYGARHVVGSAGANASTVSTGESDIEAKAVRSTSPARRPVADRNVVRVDVKNRLERLAVGTYIGELLAAHDSALARWPDRRLKPLRVWIQPIARIEDWSPTSVSLVRDAFIDWSDTGIPLSFSFVLDSSSANVRVTFVDRFREPISGKTLWSHDDRWWILEASIVLAVHHRTGEILDAAATRAIALHEVGHLIGLDHTTDTTSIMTPRVRVRDLSAADRATAQLLYLLPPGRIGGGGGQRAAR
ncbi:MAG: matrixin family metalloprotease [Gemmatimonadaceae bacterium]|nr:matrixin family metalloprotease [Gemmatimonadaceae bacterium]